MGTNIFQVHLIQSKHDTCTRRKSRFSRAETIFPRGIIGSLTPIMVGGSCAGIHDWCLLQQSHKIFILTFLPASTSILRAIYGFTSLTTAAAIRGNCSRRRLLQPQASHHIQSMTLLRHWEPLHAGFRINVSRDKSVHECKTSKYGLTRKVE